MNRSLTAMTFVLILTSATTARSEQWRPVTGEENLRSFMSGTTLEWEEPGAGRSRGEYRPDGSGTLYSWGAAFPRTWEVKGDDQVCVTARRVTQCWQLEKSAADPSLYRSRDVATGRITEIRMSGDGTAATVKGGAETAGNMGGAAAASADEVAAEVSAPNGSIATLKFKNKFVWYEGDLPDADHQSSYTLVFQPTLPFVLGSGNKFIWRPAVPVLFDQPVPTAGGFESKSGLGDISFDLAFAPKGNQGLIFAYGIFSSLPTATNDLGSKKWTLGPELLLGKAAARYLFGVLPYHQWDVAGSGDRDINLTTAQLFFTYLPGNGWSVGSGPYISYDWNREQWTIPLQANIGKTVVVGGRPWKIGAEVNYYVEKADAFGPEWMFSFNIAPVVQNGLASLFGL